MGLHLPETGKRVFFFIALIMSFFVIATYFLSMGVGIVVLFFTPEGLDFSRQPYTLYPLRLIDIPVTVNAGLYFIFLWTIFALCFAAAWKYRESLSRKVREFFSTDGKQNYLKNNLLAMPLITAMLLVATLALDTLQEQVGIPTGSLPPGDPFLTFLSVSRAPLVEEIIFRILPLGTFLVTFIYLIGKRTRPDFSRSQRLKTSILSVLQPEKAKKIVGVRTIGERGMFRGVLLPEWMMVIFTALLFGFAHYWGGWGPGKISEATISGAVFALAYLYYGIQAPILLHWFFNYYFSVFGLSLDFYLVKIDFLSLSLLANFFLGTIAWLTIIILGLVATVSAVMKKLEREPEPTPKVPIPPPV